MKNLEVKMIHESLVDTPIFPLPLAGFNIETYRPGREQDWLRIHELADRFNIFTPFVFNDQFGQNESKLTSSQFYLVNPDGKPVGTATAWTKDSTTYSGMVHWVAILPEYQGKGLSKPLLTAVCQKLVADGHSKGCLSTSTARIAAISLYLQFGFRPLIQSDQDEVSWLEFEEHSGRRLSELL